MEKIKNLQDTHNLQVTVMWEHEWTEMKKSDNRMINFLKDFLEHLNRQDAIYGGQTNALYVHYVAQPGEQIDFDSSMLCKKLLFPLRAPSNKNNVTIPEHGLLSKLRNLLKKVIQF